jgi:4-oxalocrotonate tautomerase
MAPAHKSMPIITANRWACAALHHSLNGQWPLWVLLRRRPPGERKETKGEKMPHVIVKLWLGKSDKQKTKLAEEITKAVMTTLNYGEESVSVAMEEIEPKDWTEKVYKPDILAKAETLYKKPGYDPL